MIPTDSLVFSCWDMIATIPKVHWRCIAKGSNISKVRLKTVVHVNKQLPAEVRPAFTCFEQIFVLPAQELSLYLPNGIACSVRHGSLTRKLEGYRRYILDADRWSKSIL